MYKKRRMIRGDAVRAEEILPPAVVDWLVLSIRVTRPTDQKLYNEFFFFSFSRRAVDFEISIKELDGNRSSDWSTFRSGNLKTNLANRLNGWVIESDGINSFFKKVTQGVFYPQTFPFVLLL